MIARCHLPKIPRFSHQAHESYILFLFKTKLPWRPMVSTADNPKCQNHKLMTATYNHDITVHPFKSHWPSPHCTTIVLLCLEPPMSILKGGRGASPTGGVVQTPNLTKSITNLTIKHKYNKIKLGSNETQIQQNKPQISLLKFCERSGGRWRRQHFGCMRWRRSRAFD